MDPKEPSGSSRFVERLHTVSEIESDTDRCLVCGAASGGSTYGLDFAAGASTLDMTVPVPSAPLCAGCCREQSEAMLYGGRAIFVALFVPPALVVLGTVLAPLGTPVVLLVLAALSVAALRALVALIAHRRARRTRILFLDGAGDDVLLQLRVEAGPDAAPKGYRAVALDRPRATTAEDRPVKPRGPKMRATLGLVLSVFATAIATLVGWFGAYPMVVFDNPTDRPHALSIDGVHRSTLPPRGHLAMPLGYGKHRISFVDESPAYGPTEHGFDLDMGFGRNELVTTDAEQCYQVTWRPQGKLSGYTTLVRGRAHAIDEPKGIDRAPCPKSPFW